MTMNAEQMRKKEAAQQESERHALYARADGSMRMMNTEPKESPAIEASERRTKAAYDKERESMGPQDPSPNASIRF
jgi:hypothetical protein